MSGDPLRNRLSGLAHLSDEDMALLDQLTSDVRPLGVRQEIASEGQPRYLHVLVEGWAARYEMLPNTSRQITAFLMPGDFCDLQIAIGSRAKAKIRALSPCKVAWIDFQDFRQLTAKRVGIMSALWRAALVEQVTARDWIVNLGRRDAHRRIAHLICEIHTRLKTVGSEPISWPISQKDLADATGLTQVHVNRVVRKLRDSGLIELTRQSLRINDVQALRELAWFAPTICEHGLRSSEHTDQA